MYVFNLVYAATLSSLLCKTVGQSFSVQIEPYTIECFFEHVNKGETLHFSFEVTDGGFLDLDLIITDPNSKVLRRLQNKSRDAFRLPNVILDGVYNCCLSNNMSTVSPKTVHIVFMVDNRSPLIPDNVTEIGEEINKLWSDLQAVRLDQWNMIARTHVHTRINQHTNNRVVLWTWIQILVTILAGIMQIRYFKKLFDAHFIV